MIRDDLAEEMYLGIREYEAGTERSRQTALGWSGVGTDCDRQLWSTLHKAPRPNADNVRILAALRGHAVHAYLGPLLERWGWTVEAEVEWAGIPGHVDAHRGSVAMDLKTSTADKVRALRLHGPERGWRVQVQGYARALVEKGHPIDTVRILALATDSSEERVVWEAPFDAQVSDDAVEHVAEMADMDDPPRPGKDEAFCRDWCVFYGPDSGGCPSMLAGAALAELDDPALRSAVLDHVEAKAARDAADKRVKAAAALLEGQWGTVDGWTVRQASRKGSTTVDVGALDREGYELLVGPWPERQGAPSSWVEVRPTRKAKP